MANFLKFLPLFPCIFWLYFYIYMDAVQLDNFNKNDSQINDVNKLNSFELSSSKWVKMGHRNLTHRNETNSEINSEELAKFNGTKLLEFFNEQMGKKHMETKNFNDVGNQNQSFASEFNATIFYNLLANIRLPKKKLPLEEFEWAPFVDVRAEVDQQLLGEKPQSPVVNDWSTFRTLIQPNCTKMKKAKGKEKREILVLVKTAPDRIEEREAIRATFGSFKSDGPLRIRFIFVMGSLLKWRTDWMSKLRAEALEFDDMLVADHQDDYFHSSQKFANSIKFAHHFCGGPIPFLMLLDDDYLLFPWELIREVQKHSPEERLYMGYCYFGAKPFRDGNKWAVTHREYPFEEYPPYCTGGTVLLSPRTVEEFYLAIQHTEFFIWEDVYTGILAHFLGIVPQHNSNFFGIPSSWAPNPLDCKNAGRQWPKCREWKGVISAHGYFPGEIRQIYAQIQRKWQKRKELN